jgi:glyoxylase-like metal-dependent hydrolase (beta-lactamase superfamily II)
MILERVVVGMMEVNCYVLAGAKGRAAAIIDPGGDCLKIKQILKKHGLEPAFIINTHGHIDHIGCDNDFNVPVYVHKADEPFLLNPELNLSAFFMSPFAVSAGIRTVDEGDSITLGDMQLDVLHIPGHTPGGIALLLKKPPGGIIFTGDSLFNASIGRSDFAGGSGQALIRAIKSKLLVLPGDTIVYPGHGPSSTIGAERENNPFLLGGD